MRFKQFEKYRGYNCIKINVLFAIMLFMLSCNKENAPDCFKRAGEYSTVTRMTEPFSSIELNDYIQIELYDTTIYFVEITAPRNLLPEIETSVNNGRLKIVNNNTCNLVRSFKNKITVRIYENNRPHLRT